VIISGVISRRHLVTAQPAFTPVPLPVEELEAGAWLRDHGRLRRVQCVEPAVASQSVRIFFEDDPGEMDWLRVDVGQMVTAWRDQSDG